MILGFTGLATQDYYPRCESVEAKAEQIVFRRAGGVIEVPLLEEFRPGSKPLADIPPALYGWADRIEAGGGACNSAMIARLIDRDTVFRYGDAAGHEPALAEELGRRDIDYWAFALRDRPRNVVFGCRSAADKGVLRAFLCPPAQTSTELVGGLDWLRQCGAVLANSVKDRAVMTPLASAASRNRLRLYAMLTPSLPSDYMVDAVVPWSRAVIVGRDDLQGVLNMRIDRTFEDSLTAARYLYNRSQTACVFVTMGAEGILAADIATAAIYHVTLAPPVAREVAALVRNEPSSVCGCGDAAAAGIFLQMEMGKSLVAGHPSDPPAVAAARAGVAAALLRLGFAGVLTRSSFDASLCSVRSAA